MLLNPGRAEALVGVSRVAETSRVRETDSVERKAARELVEVELMPEALITTASGALPVDADVKRGTEDA